MHRRSGEGNEQRLFAQACTESKVVLTCPANGQGEACNNADEQKLRVEHFLVVQA